MIRRSLIFVAIAFAVYVGLALALVAWPPPAEKEVTTQATGELTDLVRTGDLGQPAAPEFFVARDGAKRLYRRYLGSGPDVLVFLHGSGSDARYLARFARSIAELTGVTVVTPDMRGHGAAPGRRGDVDTVVQQEDDIADIASALRASKPFKRFLVGGHSIGGGLAIRYASGDRQPRPDALLLLAPYIHRNSPAARADSGGWATPFVLRFAGIEMLQRLGIHAFDGLPVLRFEIPPSARDGTETPLYSWRLFASVTPRPDWKADIRRIVCPVLVLGAEQDAIFRSEGYTEIFASLQQARVEIIPSINHFRLVTSLESPQRTQAWLARQI